MQTVTAFHGTDELEPVLNSRKVYCPHLVYVLSSNKFYSDELAIYRELVQRAAEEVRQTFTEGDKRYWRKLTGKSRFTDKDLAAFDFMTIDFRMTYLLN